MTEYNKDYFENGVSTHVSGYTNYRWKPEYVLPLANYLKGKFGKDKIYLDYGCAKGFLVKALRLLDCQAYGYDVSTYAIDNAEEEVKPFVHDFLIFDSKEVDVIIAKDILEHVSKEDISSVLDEFSNLTTQYVVAIIPLGDNGTFRIREYELDVTHVTKEDEVWWIDQFSKAGFACQEFYYSIEGIKDNWKQFPTGNGIFIFKKVM